MEALPKEKTQKRSMFARTGKVKNEQRFVGAGQPRGLLIPKVVGPK